MEHLVVTKHGLLKCRSVRRKPPGKQWSRRETIEARGTKWNFDVEMDSGIPGPTLEPRRDEGMPTGAAPMEIPTVPPPAPPPEEQVSELRGQGAHAKALRIRAFWSEKGRMTFLTGSDSTDKNGLMVHLIGCSSTSIGRVCWSTQQAETYAFTDGVEESMRLRAALADAHGVFLRTDWEYHTARFMRHVWMIDCNSLNDHLRSPTFTKSVELRCDKWSASVLMESY